MDFLYYKCFEDKLFQPLPNMINSALQGGMMPDTGKKSLSYYNENYPKILKDLNFTFSNIKCNKAQTTKNSIY